MSQIWQFSRDGTGWYWFCLDRELVMESSEVFQSRAECIADAMRHGYADAGWVYVKGLE
ncbi:MAG: hypothetical protein ACXWI6_10145 [Burkholderiales bacterium]